MARCSAKLAVFLCLLLFVHSFAVAQTKLPASSLTEGQWLDIRGDYMKDGSFTAHRVDLVQPERYESLIGTVTAQAPDGSITLLGQRVELNEKTDTEQVSVEALLGVRVKVEGYFRSENKFSARKIRPRGEGRERITGRIDRITGTRDNIELTIINYRVVLPGNQLVRNEMPPGDLLNTEPGVDSVVDRNRNEELFGKGIWIAENIMLAGQVQLRGTREDNFNLNDRDAEDRDDLEATGRMRFIYQPSRSFFTLAEFNFRQLWRSDEDKERFSVDDVRTVEIYGYWFDPFGIGLDLQAGRMDFVEEREWLYDQNLDAVRAVWTGRNLRAEISYSETLSDGSPLDESASNTMFYLSNNDYDEHLGTYIIHRDFDLDVPIRRTHYGVRAYGEWMENQESWLEISYVDGKTGSTSEKGWGLDLGSSWELHDNFALNAGYALGQGDRPGEERDHTFRQTGLHDNNAKFAGVTSFRYYGELVDPELANLQISTLGVTWLPSRAVSLDLVWHNYRQDALSTRLVDTQLDRRPNGRDKDLGSEIDLVFGWRTGHSLDIEIVAAWFKPGKAFDNTDDAFLAKAQFRYRF